MKYIFIFLFFRIVQSENSAMKFAIPWILERTNCPFKKLLFLHGELFQAWIWQECPCHHISRHSHRYHTALSSKETVIVFRREQTFRWRWIHCSSLQRPSWRVKHILLQPNRPQKSDQRSWSQKVQYRLFIFETQTVESVKWMGASLSPEKVSPVYFKLSHLSRWTLFFAIMWPVCSRQLKPPLTPAVLLPNQNIYLYLSLAHSLQLDAYT